MGFKFVTNVLLMKFENVTDNIHNTSYYKYNKSSWYNCNVFIV